MAECLMLNTKEDTSGNLQPLTVYRFSAFFSVQHKKLSHKALKHLRVNSE